MGESVEQRGGHLGVAEDGRPFAEGQVGGDDDRGPLVEPADEMEQQLPAGLREGQVAELVEDDEVEPGQVLGDAALLAGAVLGLELVDEIDDVEEAAARTVADQRPGNRDGQVRLAGAGRSRVIVPATTMVTAEYAIDSILSVANPLSLQRASDTAVIFS